jgi:hypothetical protein
MGTQLRPRLEIRCRFPWDKFVKYDDSFDRPAEPAQLIGCAEKIQRELG